MELWYGTIPYGGSSQSMIALNPVAQNFNLVRVRTPTETTTTTTGLPGMVVWYTIRYHHTRTTTHSSAYHHTVRLSSEIFCSQASHRAPGKTILPPLNPTIWK